MMSQSKMQPLDNFYKLIFIDIETVPLSDELSKLSPEYSQHWKNKVIKQLQDPESLEELENSYKNRAGIYAEFGKIICIGLGMFIDNTFKTIKLKSIALDNEKELLTDFIALLNKLETKYQIQFVGHNIKEFDLAFICRRSVVHQLVLPKCLQLSTLKPWQHPHIDTMEMWRFGDYKNYTSLDLLATSLNVPSSKTDISGKDVAKVYYEQQNLKRISKYCLQDVYTTALVYLRLSNISITDVNAIFVDSE